MPVKKFRSVEESRGSLWLEADDPRIWDASVRRWQLHKFFAPEPARRPPGVFKYRSIEEKQRASSRQL